MSVEINTDNIEVVGFDLDQTLYPKSPAIDEAIQLYLYEHIARKYNCTIQEAEQQFAQLYQSGEGLSGGKAMEALGFQDGGELVQQALEQADISPYLVPNMRHVTILDDWRERYRLDILTGSNRRNTMQKLAQLSIDSSKFNHIITSDDASKSSGEAYRLWMSLYPGLEPRNFLYIGDRFKSDHIIPSAYGIGTIIINIVHKKPEYDCLQLTSFDELAAHLSH